MIKDVPALERVQRQATKLVPEERCQQLETLSRRRKRGDKIETYKLLHGFEDVSYTRFFSHNTNNLRGHSLKLAKPDHWRINIIGNWLAIRVIDD